MRILFTYILLGSFQICFGQFYLSDQAILEVNPDALLQVNNADIENNGSIHLEGIIDLNGNMLNSDVLESQAGSQSSLEVAGDWINNGSFSAGVGVVLLNGNTQAIGGSGPNVFYNLTSSGDLADTKQLLANTEVTNQLDIGKNRIDIGSFELTLRNPRLPVKENGGFIHNGNPGRVRLISTSANIIPYPVPFGYNPANPVRRKISLENAPAGDYSMALLNPGISRESRFWFDSTCRMLQDHIWYISASENVRTAIEIGPGEDIFTQIHQFQDQIKWIPRNTSNSGHSLSFPYLSTSFSAGEQQFMSINSERPYVTLEADRDLLESTAHTIDVKYQDPGKSTFSWSPSDQLNCDNCPFPIFKSEYPDMIKVQIENDGCVAEDEVYYNVLIRKDVYMQNAFSPNGDGINDQFNPVLLDFEQIELFKVFNRWGVKIHDAPHAWDGTYLGEKVDPGVYVYELSVRRIYSPTKEKVVHKSGSIQVLR